MGLTQFATTIRRHFVPQGLFCFDQIDLERKRKEGASKLIRNAQVSNICISTSPCRYCLIDGGLGPPDERV